MVVDQSRRKRGWGESFRGDGFRYRAGRHHKRLAGDLLAQAHRALGKRRLVTQRGITDPRHLVGQRTGRLVVIGSALHVQRPLAHTADLAPGACGHLGGALNRTFCGLGQLGENETKPNCPRPQNAD